MKQTMALPMIAAAVLVCSCYLPLRAQTPGLQAAPRLSEQDLVFTCGSAGLGVDFVAGSCVTPYGDSVNPHNLYPDFQAPLPQPTPSNLIMRCRGRAVDFVTGKCM